MFINGVDIIIVTTQGSRRLDGDGSDETEDPSLHLSNELSR